MTAMDATSHMCTGDPIHMQTQIIGAFAAFNSFQPTWEDLLSVVTTVSELFPGKTY